MNYNTSAVNLVKKNVQISIPVYGIVFRYYCIMIKVFYYIYYNKINQ